MPDGGEEHESKHVHKVPPGFSPDQNKKDQTGNDAQIAQFEEELRKLQKGKGSEKTVKASGEEKPTDSQDDSNQTQ